MKTVFLLALSAVLLVTGPVMADDKPVIPPGVRYKFLDDQQDAAMRALLAAKFQQGDAAVAELFQGPCTIAPGYWKIIADTGTLQKKIPTTFSVPNAKTGAKDKLEGATTKDPDDLRRVAQHFAADVGKNPVIRRLTTEEITQVWAVIPFDIEEPVYVLENGPRHFVIFFLKNSAGDGYNAWWVDALTEYGDIKPKP